MILIFSENINPRLAWITDVFFSQMAKLTVQLTSNHDEFQKYDGLRINYSTTEIENVIQVIPHSILSESNVVEQNILVDKNPFVTFFQNNDDFLGFDFLAASFYLLSRYEEYLPHTKDEHDRYKFENSLASKYDFIEIPVVDHWVLKCIEACKTFYPNLNVPGRKFKSVITMDVDVAYAYKGRSTMRNLRSTAKDLATLNFDRIAKRRAVKKGEKDPFDNYAFFDEEIKKYGFEKKYFFLLGDYGTYDKNLSPEIDELKNLIKERIEFAGSHPSYASHANKGQLKNEKERLEKITGQNVLWSRFHYLKFEFPESFNRLINQGYIEDYSLCYPEQPGFRAGTCSPFSFYDLSNEMATSLVLYPTAVMDATCQDYLKLTPDQAQIKIDQLINAVREVNGTFILLWHNDSLSDEGRWMGWKAVFQKTLEYASLKV